MPRSEGRILTSIWSDDEFRKLSISGQRMYLFLISQPDLAYDGVIGLRERRWARSADGMTPQDVWNALKELSSEGFVVLDEETEECFVRSYMRRDKVYLEPHLVKAAIGHVASVQSLLIMNAIFTETTRIIRENTDEARSLANLSPLTPNQKANIRSLSVTLGLALSLDPGVTWENVETKKTSSKADQKTSAKRPRGKGKGEGLKLGSSKTLVTVPQKNAAEAALASEQLTLPGVGQGRAGAGDADFQRFYEAYPKKRDRDTARRAFDKRVRKEKVPVEQIIIAAVHYARSSKGRGNYAKYPATFLNSGSFLDYVDGVPDDEKLEPDQAVRLPRCPDHRGQLAENCPYHEPEETNDRNDTSPP